MCATKEYAGSKMDRVIASMDRLSAALENAGGTAYLNGDVPPEGIQQAIREAFTAAMERLGLDAPAISARYDLHLIRR